MIDAEVRALGRSDALTVASSTLPAEARQRCDYECDGVDDQAQINAALLRATRENDGLGGEGWGKVLLVGSDFSIADDNSSSILMPPTTTLEGGGFSTILEPKWSNNAIDRGCIELLNNNAAHVAVRNLTVGRHNAVTIPGHGIKFVGSGDGSTYELKTGNDPFNSIHGVAVLKTARKGIWLTGASGGSRESQMSWCLLWNSEEECLMVDGSSDSQISNIRVNGGGTNVNAAEIGGGNTKLSDSKSYYSEGTGAGWLVSSSRCEISDCASQDAGGWGFDFQGTDVTATGLVADSNSRESTAGGFRIAADGLYSGLHAFDRNQTPASRQDTAIAFSGSRQVILTGRTSVPSGGTHVSGSPAANSFARVVRDGATLYSQG
ncbi:MAG: hypothetical protein WBH03_21370 [Cyclobacteriaceae bacterium]